MKKLREILIDEILEMDKDAHHNCRHVAYRQAILLANRLYAVTGFGENRMSLRQVGELLGVSADRARQLEQKLIRKIQWKYWSMKMRANQKYAVVKANNLPAVLDQKSLVTALPIEALHLSVRTRNILALMGVKNVEQLVNISRQYMMCQPNFGKVSLQELECQLKRLGLSLAENQTFHAITED